MYISNYNYKSNTQKTVSFGEFTTRKTQETEIQQILKDIDSQICLFENPKFYDFFEENKSTMVKQIGTLYNRSPWGDDKGRNIISEFTENISDKHLALLCDPGIVSRIDKLYEFVKKLPVDINKITTLELRKMFSDSLGTKKYYRGMTLTQEQIESIKKNGIKSINFSDDNRESIFKSLFLGTKDFKYTSFRNFMRDKISGENRDNPMISITQLESIAQKVPEKYSRPKNSNQKIYIFELEIPQINVVEPIKEFDMSYPGFGFYDRNGNKIPKEKVESFVPFFINSNCIKSIKTYTPQPIRPYF